MTQTNLSNLADKIVTKQYLKEAMKKYATKADVKNVEKTLRSDLLRLEGRMENVEEKMTNVEGKMTNVEGKLGTMDEDNKGYRDEVMNKLDNIVGQLENLRIDNEIGANQTYEIRKQLENHEKRIESLEQTQG